MQAKALLPLIDLVLLSFGAILACMTEMERVEYVPVELAQVGRGAVAVKHGDFDVITASSAGLFLNAEPVTREELPGRLRDREVVLRAAGDVPTEMTLGLTSDLIELGIDVSLGVEGETGLQNTSGRSAP